MIKRLLHSRLAIGILLLAPVLCAIGGWVCWRLLPPLDPSSMLRGAASGQLLDRDGERLYVALARDETWSLPVDPDEISPVLIQATVAAEDQRFWSHRGVDPVAILRAVGQNLREAGVASGASTLSMQLIKLSGHESRTPGGKLTQAVQALRLEKSATKSEILSAYLNRAPYGMNVVGVEAAAWRYFGKSADTLNLPEAALLAALPKAPSLLNPLEHPERARVRRDYVLRRICDDGYIDTDQRDWALTVPVQVSWHDFPRHAPHLAAPLSASLARGEAVTLTLDRELQARLEEELPGYLKRFDNGITNGAVLVADVATGAVLARVASAGFDGVPGGHVDACRALRSPGSTLKPFLYGWALAHQELYPREVLLDDVLDYGGYNPGNFDGTFNGVVTATEALRFSLNVPAVSLLGRVGVPEFVTWLRESGLSTINRGPEHYGLGLAIGNCEVRLEELARLYLSVASLGEQNRLYWREGLPGAEGPLLAPGVCRVLYDMLAQPFPDEQAAGAVRASGQRTPVCWKTGTSTGYHDAWTFAFNRHYLVAVWLGNNSGAENRQLVGFEAALPLAAQVFRSLPLKTTPAWPAPDPTDSDATFCAGSGLPAGPGCVETMTLRLPQSIWTGRRCTLHPASQTGLMVAAARPADPSVWNLGALAAQTVAGEEAVQTLGISTPAAGAEYVLSGVPDGDRLRLTASRSEREALHWYANDLYLGQSTPETPVYWTLSLGEHRITCVGQDGTTATAGFTVVRPASGVPIR